MNQTKDGLKDGFNADDFSLNISIGSQKSKTESSSITTVAQGSTVKADGNVNITATEKDINIKGSDISGEDTNISGSKVSGGSVEMHAGGNLNIESQQDSQKYDEKYTSGGLNVNINNGAKDNEKGVTPNIGMPAQGENESTTQAGVAQGTIEITDKENQKQNIEDLNRDTKNTLNKLEQIFDKQTVAERKEMAALFGELAYNVVHNIDGTPEQKAALHALVGGIMGELTGSGFLAGASGAAVNKLLSDELKKIAGDDPALHQWLSAALGAVVSDVVAGNAQAGSSTAASGTKNNDLMLTPEELSELVFDNDRAEEYCKQQGIPVTQENIEKLKTGFTNFAKENSESDAVIATGGFGVEGSYIYDLKAQESYLAAGGSGGKGGIGAALSLVAIKIVSSDSSIDLNDAKVRKDILSGTSIGANFYVGVGGGISIPLNFKYSGRITIIVKGIGTPQVGISGSNAQAGSDIANDRYNEALDNKYGSD